MLGTCAVVPPRVHRICFKAKWDVWVINCFHDHPLLYTTAHFSLSSSQPALFFLFYFCGDLRLSFFTNREELVGSLVLLIFFLFLFLGCNWGKAFFHSSYCPKLNSPHTPFSYLAPPKPDISHCFGIGSPHSALFHIMKHVYFVAIIPPFALKSTEIHIQYFLSLCSNLIPCSTLFSSLPSFSTSPSFVFPHCLHSPLRLGGESAVPAEQHWRGGQRHVPTLCQPSYRISL